MNKNLLSLVFLSVFLPVFSAEAFLLPPFKLDAGTIGNEVVSYGNTSSQTASKGLQQAAIVQTAITYGKGAKEAYEFATKMLKEFKGINLNNLGEMLDKMSEMEAEQSKTKEDAAVEIVAKTREANAKIAELDANTRELNKKIAEEQNQKKIKKYQKQAEKNEKEKKKISEKLIKETRQINRSTEKKIGNLANQIGEMKNKASELISSITTISDSYDSAKDLNLTAETLLPGADTEVDPHVMETYAAIYRVNYYKMLSKAAGRAMLIKSMLAEDNEKADKNKLSSAEFESLGGSVGILVKMKTDNIQALLNFTEILLQKMQLDVAKDLALENFTAANPVQAAGDFNLDNYRFTPPTEAEREAKGGEKPEKLKELEKEITPSSANILTEGRKHMSAGAGDSTESENTATTGAKNDEKKQ